MLSDHATQPERSCHDLRYGRRRFLQTALGTPTASNCRAKREHLQEPNSRAPKADGKSRWAADWPPIRKT